VPKPEGERDHFENLGVDGRVILKYISNKSLVNMDWVDLALNNGVTHLAVS
jgi:hypothetical protein